MIEFGRNPGVDDSVWFSTDQIRIGINMATGQNQFAVCVQGVITVTNSPVSYEKALREMEVHTYDPSDYDNGITRDAVGDDTRATIMPGNMTGRAWGAYCDSVVEHGADGLAIGQETNVVNYGSDQPLLDQVNSKYSHLITASGEQPATAALYATGNAGYHHGFAMRTDQFTPHLNDSFLVLYKAGTNDPVFRIDSQGNLTHAFGRKVVPHIIEGIEYLTLQ